VTLLSICDICENRLREGRTFLEAFVKLHLPLYCESNYFKITGSLGKICVLPVRYALRHFYFIIVGSTVKRKGKSFSCIPHEDTSGMELQIHIFFFYLDARLNGVVNLTPSPHPKENGPPLRNE
jgi:hypothetical protein